MSIQIEGFGSAVASRDLTNGQIAICDLGQNGQYLVMRAEWAGEAQDLYLLCITAGAKPRPLPLVRPTGQVYTSVPGNLLIRPLAPLPIPGEPEAGSLVIDPQGRPFIRVEEGGVMYVALDTGHEEKPGNDRRFYSAWQMVMIGDGKDRVIAHFGATAAAPDQPKYLTAPQHAVV